MPQNLYDQILASWDHPMWLQNLQISHNRTLTTSNGSETMLIKISGPKTFVTPILVFFDLPMWPQNLLIGPNCTPTTSDRS